MQLVVYFERLQKKERGKYRKQSCTTKLRYSVCIFDARFVHVVVCGFSLFAFFIAFKIFAAQVVVTPAPPITKRLRAQSLVRRCLAKYMPAEAHVESLASKLDV